MKLKLNNSRDTILPTHINYLALHGGQHSYVTKKPIFIMVLPICRKKV